MIEQAFRRLAESKAVRSVRATIRLLRVFVSANGGWPDRRSELRKDFTQVSTPTEIFSRQDFCFYGMVIPNFVRQALAGKPLTVHGTGLQTRSFTWVGDVVWALLALVAEPRSVGEVFNIGNGAEVSIRQLAAMVVAMADSDSDMRFVPYHEVFGHNFDDMSRRVPDISKVRRLVGSSLRYIKNRSRARHRYWLPDRRSSRRPCTFPPGTIRRPWGSINRRPTLKGSAYKLITSAAF